MRPVHDSLLSPVIPTQSCSANKWGQFMIHCSIQWYPLSPAQPTNEASPWLIAQSSAIHSVLLSDIHSVLLSQQMRPVHDSMPNPTIYPSSSAQPTNESSKPITQSPVEHYSLSPAQPTNDGTSLHRWPNLMSSVIGDGDKKCKFIAWSVVPWCCSVFICQQSTYLVRALACSNLPKFTVAII